MREDVILILENHYLSMVAVKIQRDVVLVGQSLGRRGLDDKQGTFGGFVGLQHPHTHEWASFGISCAHSVLPDDAHVEVSNLEGKAKTVPFLYNIY